ncbi:Ras-related protein Rab-24 [Acipenser ruthenus]|uniref:Ras-related protein Rab-24 n=1 Tax=Acipenser ruthenus TaxID=7906 RepID=A0A444V0A9_ACIRT|nr:Ras-related protein Rab-24 [Acipenser ruthenus]
MSGQRVDAKVVMLGKEYVGKTSLVERYVHKRFLVGPYQNLCRIYLCGTKSDLVGNDRSTRKVDYHDVQDYADEIKAQLFETSSKEGRNIDELFQKVAEDYHNSTSFQLMTEEKGVDLGQKRDSYFYSCCH